MNNTVQDSNQFDINQVQHDINSQIDYSNKNDNRQNNVSNVLSVSDDRDILNAAVKTFENDGEIHSTSEIQTAIDDGYKIINLGGNLFKKSGTVTLESNIIIDGNGAKLYGTSGNSGFFQVTGKTNIIFKNIIVRVGL